MFAASLHKIPVDTPYGTKFVDRRRASFYALALNAVLVRNHANGQVVRIILREVAADHDRRGRRGNAQKHIHNGESATNPPRVFEFKRRFGILTGRAAHECKVVA